jgi:hypothetical protein
VEEKSVGLISLSILVGHGFLHDLTPYEFLKEQNIPLQDGKLNLNMVHTMG